MSTHDAVTLGVLAGGRGSRLGGRDKAWLMRDGEPQVVRLVRGLEAGCATTLVSANRDLPRYADHDLVAIPDRVADRGPMGGLDALAAVCTTPWLLTVPVDLAGTVDGLLPTLAGLANLDGAVAEDDDGVQPLVALYRVEALRDALACSLAAGDFAVRTMQSTLRLPHVRFGGVRFGNLNTPGDLRMAGYGHE